MDLEGIRKKMLEFHDDSEVELFLNRSVDYEIDGIDILIKSGVKFKIRRDLYKAGHIFHLKFSIDHELPKNIFFPCLKKVSFYKSKIPKKEFFERHAETLKVIYISECRISEIPEFGTLPNLEVLHIINSDIKTLESARRLGGCSNLRELCLNNNRISELYQFEPLSHLLNLERVSLNYNNLSIINITEGVLNLRELSLANNQIKQIFSIQNLPNLTEIDLSENQIKILENLENLPRLETILIFSNPIISISGLENLVSLKKIDKICLGNLNIEKINNIFNYIHSIDLQTDLDYEWRNFSLQDYDCFYIYGPYPSQKFKINKLIELKLIKDETKLFIAGEEFIQCKFLLLTIPTNYISLFNNIDSIDDASEILNKTLESYNGKRIDGILPEVEFWGHCSNLQAWVENNYDTRLLHSNIAFPLLKRLYNLGDLIAKRVFKEEIAKRYSSNNSNVIKFLEEEGYLGFLKGEELQPVKCADRELNPGH